MNANPETHQPIHPEIRAHLDPEYVAFHDKHLQTILPSELSSWDSSLRFTPSAFGFASLKSVEVQSIEDVILKHCQLRVFIPRATPPKTGWPVVLWFHGGRSFDFFWKNFLILLTGGWTLGNLESDNAFCSQMSNGKRLK